MKKNSHKPLSSGIPVITALLAFAAFALPAVFLLTGIPTKEKTADFPATPRAENAPEDNTKNSEESAIVAAEKPPLPSPIETKTETPPEYSFKLLNGKDFWINSVIENNTKKPLRLQIDEVKKLKGNYLSDTRFEILRDGKWEPVIILKCGLTSGAKLTIPAKSKSEVYVNLQALDGRISLPATIRVRTSANDLSITLISAPATINSRGEISTLGEQEQSQSR